jgi:hypothetical protein
MILITALLAGAALAAPPSSHLSGPDGQLTWDVSVQDSQLHVEGHSPKWTVVHAARADLTPLSTEHTDADGRKVSIQYGPTATVVTLPDRQITYQRADLWDADTLDVRIGSRFAAGDHDLYFAAVDTGSGKVYSFQAHAQDPTTCGVTPCTEVDLQLTGLLRLVGPTWKYWYAADGRLVRFEGPAGKFAAADGGDP